MKARPAAACVCTWPGINAV